MRRDAIVASCGVHAALVAVLVAIGVSAPPAVDATTTAIEIDEVVAPATRPIDGGGGGTPAKAAPRPRHVDAKPRAVVPATPDGDDADPRIAVADVRAGDGDDGSGGGTGGGRGRGHGPGVGDGTSLGEVTARLTSEPLPAVPQPKISRARPPRLIYPTTDRETEPDHLFVATVTIDEDGYVVGAHLTRANGPRTSDAAGLIFKFRYEPALDDDGRPIRATLEQPFQVR